MRKVSAAARHCVRCSLVSKWGTHRMPTFQKPAYVTIWWIDLREISIQCWSASCSQILSNITHRSSSKMCYIAFFISSFVASFNHPSVSSSCTLARLLSWKRCTYSRTVHDGITSTPYTIHSRRWISAALVLSRRENKWWHEPYNYRTCKISVGLCLWTHTHRQTLSFELLFFL